MFAAGCQSLCNLDDIYAFSLKQFIQMDQLRKSRLIIYIYIQIDIQEVYCFVLTSFYSKYTAALCTPLLPVRR